MRKLFSAASLALLSSTALMAPAFGQTEPADTSVMVKDKDGKEVPAVTVNGSRASELDERRQSTAGKQGSGREELDRNGDTSLGDGLNCVPGVAMGGKPGRGGEIRMRGLGSGYAQV